MTRASRRLGRGDPSEGARSPRQTAAIVPDRRVERPLALGQELRDLLLLDEPGEVLGVLVGLVARLVDVLLVEEEQVRVLLRSLRLVEEAAGLRPRRRRHLLYHLEQAIRLARMRPPFGGNDVGHSQAPFRPIVLRRTPMPSTSSSTTSPSCSQRSSSSPDPPAAVPEPKTSPGCSVWLREA